MQEGGLVKKSKMLQEVQVNNKNVGVGKYDHSALPGILNGITLNCIEPVRNGTSRNPSEAICLE